MTKLMLVLLLPVLVACGRGDAGGALSGPRKEAALRAATAGDLKAVRRLIAHYETVPTGAEQAEHWRERARALGDGQELYHQAARRFVAAEIETDADGRYSLLQEAYEAARRAQASEPDPSKQQLVQQIADTLEAR